MFPLGLLTFLIAKPALALWINEPFSEKSYIVAQLLAIGVFINSFGYISQTLVQAYGRPTLPQSFMSPNSLPTFHTCGGWSKTMESVVQPSLGL